MKYCPYITQTKQVEQHTYDYDTDGKCTFEECIVVYDYEQAECKEAACAAWENGKCSYRK